MTAGVSGMRGGWAEAGFGMEGQKRGRGGGVGGGGSLRD